MHEYREINFIISLFGALRLTRTVACLTPRRRLSIIRAAAGYPEEKK
jgi:hypothetical protein